MADITALKIVEQDESHDKSDEYVNTHTHKNLVRKKMVKDKKKPDTAGVTTPTAITMEVPARTNIRRSFFNVTEDSSLSFIFKDLSSSGDGTLSLKLDMRLSDGS